MSLRFEHCLLGGHSLSSHVVSTAQTLHQTLQVNFFLLILPDVPLKAAPKVGELSNCSQMQYWQQNKDGTRCFLRSLYNQIDLKNSC